MKSRNEQLHLSVFYNYLPANIFRSFYFKLLLTALLFVSLISFAGNVKKNSGSSVYGNYSVLSKSFTSPLTGPETMRINLYLLNSNSTTILADGVLTEYNDLYHDSVTLEDGYKFTNINENLGLSRYGRVLAIERRPIISMSDTLFLKLWKTTVRNYQFEFMSTNLNHPGMQAFLDDAYLGTSTSLSLTATTKINFAVEVNVLSADINRFRIVYREASGASPLPVTFTSVKGYQVNNKIAIDWKVENEINIKNYEVERSVNGTNFFKINSIAVTRLNNAYSNYSATDENPAEGNNFYRIKSMDRDGSGKFSAIVKVTTGKAVTAGSIRIYPNPIWGNMINLQFTNQSSGIYEVRLINNNGQVVYSGKLPINSSNVSQALFTNKNLARGIYQMEIKAPDNTINIQQAMVQE